MKSGVILYVGLAFIVVGFAIVFGFITPVASGPCFLICANPIAQVENLVIGIAFVGIGAFLLIRSGGRGR